MTTYGRATCVERSIGMFLNQDFKGEKELIVFNTDVQYPLELEQKYDNIIIINNDKDYYTKESYDNVGAIRRDALCHAEGDYYICWDDDDIFLPWNITQCVEGVIRTGKKAWKPKKSFFNSGGNISLVQNTLEASVMADLNFVRDYGFYLETGKEHLLWYTELRNQKELNENDDLSIPGYCFNWNDPEIAPHKQSGNIGHPDNFRDHKKSSVDHATKKLIPLINLDEVYKPYLKYINDNPILFNQELINKYTK